MALAIGTIWPPIDWRLPEIGTGAGKQKRVVSGPGTGQRTSQQFLGAAIKNLSQNVENSWKTILR